MNHPLFTLVLGNIKTLFVPTAVLVPGTRGAAIKNVGDGFVSIGTIMAEGSVTPELGAIALQKCFEAQLAVNHAIAQGWENGNTAKY